MHTTGAGLATPYRALPISPPRPTQPSESAKEAERQPCRGSGLAGQTAPATILLAAAGGARCDATPVRSTNVRRCTIVNGSAALFAGSVGIAFVGRAVDAGPVGRRGDVILAGRRLGDARPLVVASRSW